MEVLLHTGDQAIRYVPQKPTYAIRIFSTESLPGHRDPLVKSPNYLFIDEHVFDDNDHQPIRVVLGPTWFDKTMARRMLTRFVEYKERAACLLVHCVQANNRSPAVVLALDDIFDLGYDSAQQRRLTPNFNRHVYDTLIEVSKELP